MTFRLTTSSDALPLSYRRLVEAMVHASCIVCIRCFSNFPDIPDTGWVKVSATIKVHKNKDASDIFPGHFQFFRFKNVSAEAWYRAKHTVRRQTKFMFLYIGNGH